MIGAGNPQEVVHLDLTEGIDYIHFPKYEYHRRQARRMSAEDAAMRDMGRHSWRRMTSSNAILRLVFTSAEAVLMHWSKE